jgi:hypothetical protein
MFVLLLQAAKHVAAPVKQATQQVIQVNPAPSSPIYVNVQQPPPGMPEWEKLLISAGVGALLGIISNIAMEYVKPWIAKRLLRRTVADQLAAELADNMNEVDAGKNLLEEEVSKPPNEQETVLTVIRISAGLVKSDRFDYYFAEQKAIVYELDEANLLVTFYKIMKSTLPLTSNPKNFTDTKQLFVMAHYMGKTYLAQHHRPFIPGESQIINAYRATRNKNQDAPGADVSPS